jgi:hypothetical protein
VDKFIAEAEERFVQADEYARMKALFEAVKSVFEQNAFALKEQAAAKASNTGKLHEMDFNARMSRYKA